MTDEKAQTVARGADVEVVVVDVNAVEVDVNVTCTREKVVATVDPWTVRVPQGGTIVWVLNQSSDADAIVVTRKTGGRWAYKKDRYDGRRGPNNPARADDMRGDQKGKTYSYNIELECNGKNVIIDPDMIITI